MRRCRRSAATRRTAVVPCLGTGLGAALVADGVVIPTELGHLPYKNGTWEDYLGARSLHKRGRKKWQQHVEFAIARLTDALAPDDIVLGGGNAKKLKRMPKGCRMGNNAYAFTGGFRLFENASRSTKE
jgi:predicted NBD/HSP70 family sugar kinase